MATKQLWLFFFGLFCCPVALLAQSPSGTSHALKLNVGMGFSNEVGMENNVPDFILHIPNSSMAVEFSYQALFFQEKMHLGIGLGYQSKACTKTYGYQEFFNGFPSISNSHYQTALSLPIELGYQFKLAPKHALTADALIIPFWATSSTILYDPGDTPIENYTYDGGMNLDVGLQLGYQLQLTKRLTGQVAARATMSPFPSTTHNGESLVSVEFYTVQLQLGLHYRLGAVL